MKQVLKYPIKFAVLEVKKEIGWINDYEEKTIGFIVSKCYVVESTIKYTADGKNEILHKVVFPFKDLSQFEAQQQSFFDSEKRTIPSYNFYGECSSADVVENLYDDYEEAFITANEKNEELQKKLISWVQPSNKSECEVVQKAFLADLKTCQEFEDFIQKNTEDMHVTKDEVKKLELIKKY